MAKQRATPPPRSNRITSKPPAPTSSEAPTRPASSSRPASSPRPRASSRAQAAPAQQRISPITIGLVLVVVAAIAGFAIFFNQQQTARPSTASNAVVPVSLDAKGIPQGVTPEGYPWKGNPDAKVVIEDFSDYQCPHCGTFATVVEPRIEEDFIKTGRVRLIFRDFQFLDRASQTQSNPMGESHRAAHAAHCAKDQNKFWDMHDMLYANQPKQANRGGFSDANLEGFAAQLGLNMDQFRSCMKDNAGEINRIIERSMNDAKGKQVQGTPTFFVNNRKVESGEYETLKAAIELAEGQAQ